MRPDVGCPVIFVSFLSWKNQASLNFTEKSPFFIKEKEKVKLN